LKVGPTKILTFAAENNVKMTAEKLMSNFTCANQGRRSDSKRIKRIQIS